MKIWVASIVLAAQSSLPAGAQYPSIEGMVRDREGSGLHGAEIVVRASASATRSDLSGRFALRSVTPGEHELIARRLGFRPETVRVTLPATGITELEVRMTAMAVAFRPVVVSGRRQDYTGRLADFYRRVGSSTGGQFITREDLMEGNPSSLTHVLRRASGVSIVHGGRVRMRGRSCAPLVWLDGVMMPSGEVDIGSFAPSSLEGVELYTSSSGAPSRFQHLRQTNCGTILLWSRDAQTEARRRAQFALTEELETLVSSLSVYTADQVQVAARPTGEGWASVRYPPELHATGMGGVVVAEIVVDTLGFMEPGSFGVVSSPHPLLSAAVAEALPRARFTPAVREGRKVRQLVQLPFRFSTRSPKDR